MRTLVLFCAFCVLCSLAAGQPLLEGEFLIDTSRTVLPSCGGQRYPRAAFDGENFLVVWDDSRVGSSYDIYGCRVARDGTLMDPLDFVISEAPDDQTTPVVAFDGSNYLVAWRDRRSGGSDIYAARVMPSGVVLDSAGIPVALLAEEYEPSIAFNGENYLVAWCDLSSRVTDIHGARVTRAGAVLDPQGFAITTAPSYQEEPAIASDGQDFFVVWQDFRNDQADIFAARVSADGQVLDTSGVAVCLADSLQASPKVSFDGRNYLVVWMDQRGEDSSLIYAARVSPEGTVLDSAGFSASKTYAAQVYPDVAFDGSEYVVVWSDWRCGLSNVLSCRISPDGVIMDTQALVVSESEVALVESGVTVGDSFYLVLWYYCDTCFSWDVAAARVTSGGMVLDTVGIPLALSGNEQRYPVAAFDGTNFLVVWQDRRSGPDYDICGMRISTEGALLDSAAIPISAAPDDQRNPGVAFDGNNYLAVWEDERHGGNGAIYAARVTVEGHVLDTAGIRLFPSSRPQRSPKVGFNGTDYLVAWYHQGNATAYDIWATRVSQAGQVLDPRGIAVCTLTYSQFPGAITAVDTTFMLFWSDGRGNPQQFTDVYGGRITAGGAVLDPNGILVSSALWGQSGPRAATDGAGYLVVWTDERNGTGNRDIYGARVKPTGDVLDPAGIPIDTRSGDQQYPAVAFDGTDFAVAWQDNTSGLDNDIYSARVTTTGVVRNLGPVVTEDGQQQFAALSAGSDQILLAYQGWAGNVGGRRFDCTRAWGKILLNTGAAEGSKALVSRRNHEATLVRGRLRLPSTQSSGHRYLLSSDGRKVADLAPGPNDVSRLAPGVYFIRRDTGYGLRDTELHKVIVTR